MDSSTLVNSDVDLVAGKLLLQRLEESNFPIVAALWDYDPDAAEWRLLIATPTVDQAGRRQAYVAVQDALRQLGLSRLTLGNVVVLSPREPLMQALRAAYGDGSSAPGWLKGTRINGSYIDQAYLYFVR